VISLNGRDASKRFIIVGIEENFSLLADGKGRKLEKPKRKKNKHLIPDGKITSKLKDKLKTGEKVTNKELRRELAQYTKEHSAGAELERRDV
jgi:ribosomal protein L14E/L6E/L27E